MPLTKSRYDGLADWYENWNGPKAAQRGTGDRAIPVNLAIRARKKVSEA